MGPLQVWVASEDRGGRGDYLIDSAIARRMRDIYPRRFAILDGAIAHSDAPLLGTFDAHAHGGLAPASGSPRHPAKRTVSSLDANLDPLTPPANRPLRKELHSPELDRPCLRSSQRLV
jgi:hypothetical protein